MRRTILAATIALVVWTVPAASLAVPADVVSSVAAKGRTPDNVALDEARKPVEMLRFLGLRKGMRVIDMVGANLYWAEIIAPAVGPKGMVVVWQPSQFLNDKRRASFAEFAARQRNVALISSPFQTPILAPRSYDFMMMNLDYHDVYWQSVERAIPRMEPDAWLKILFAAMKPGATVGIIDHSANPGGDTRETVEKLHRIDPTVVRVDFERAGFVLDGTSELLRNPADDRTANVFDPAIKGRTDRFIFRFKKPR